MPKDGRNSTCCCHTQVVKLGKFTLLSMNLLWRAEKCRQLTMYESVQVMSDFADSMQAIASTSRIIPASIQATVIPSLELVEESPIRPSEGHRSGYKNIYSCYIT